ncbi:CLUMA_CG003950, isoform A [Clunio marinus]|uniref:CLUMA_CG003950, isoform A n=1 Tax=Clunio marinus TaxID=568069 RepID=A0A1J1HQB7_9DIPT|nr:CLUMA_CG003950, isoform A [Clunio marinus]
MEKNFMILKYKYSHVVGEKTFNLLNPLKHCYDWLKHWACATLNIYFGCVCMIFSNDTSRCSSKSFDCVLKLSQIIRHLHTRILIVFTRCPGFRIKAKSKCHMFFWEITASGDADHLSFAANENALLLKGR